MSEPLTPGLPGGTPRIPLELPIFVLAISFVVTLALMPGLLRRLRRQGLVVRDMYKPGDADLVTHAGLLGLALSVAALVGTLVVEPWAYRSLPPSSDVTGPVVAAQLALFTMCGYGIVGAIDDRRPLSQLTKAVVPLTLAFPAVALAASRADSTALLALVPALQPYAFAMLAAAFGIVWNTGKPARQHFSWNADAASMPSMSSGGRSTTTIGVPELSRAAVICCTIESM